MKDKTEYNNPPSIISSNKPSHCPPPLSLLLAYFFLIVPSGSRSAFGVLESDLRFISDSSTSFGGKTKKLNIFSITQWR